VRPVRTENVIHGHGSRYQAKSNSYNAFARLLLLRKSSKIANPIFHSHDFLTTPSLFEIIRLMASSHMIQKGISVATVSALCLCVGCSEDSTSDSSGGDESGCAECAHGAQYACYCKPDAEFDLEYENCPSAPPSTIDAECSLTCEAQYGDDTPYNVREPACAKESSISCTSWSPSSYITYTSGIYHVDDNWLRSVISDPEPLWGCDDAVISPHAVGQFKIERASSGGALYELGLRTGDIPVTLNGQSLGTFAGAFAAFSQYLNGETEYTLIVLRSNIPFTLAYEIE
jgi:hypothetical protein